MDGQTINSHILVIGSIGMMGMVVAIIFFIYKYQKKMMEKHKAYREIETLLQKEELKSAYALIEGQDQERKRIASDIHDNLGSVLATLKIYSDLVLAKEQDSEMKRLNKKINEIADDLTSEIRKISQTLDTGPLQNFGLPLAIEQLSEAVRNSGKIEVISFTEITVGISNEIALHIYRIVQELFTNTLKHANATVIRSEISQTTDYLSIIFEDNGKGFEVNTTTNGSMGLKSIRSRVNKLNGELKIQSSRIGSTFIIEIPIKDVDAN